MSLENPELDIDILDTVLINSLTNTVIIYFFCFLQLVPFRKLLSKYNLSTQWIKIFYNSSLQFYQNFISVSYLFNENI